MLLDEIQNRIIMNKLREQTFPESVRMILILYPKESKRKIILPPPFLHVTLSTPYRSTIAITSLARFIAKCKGLIVPEGDIGSGVQGTKPMFFDVGRDEKQVKRALEYCRKHLGMDVTILRETFLVKAYLGPGRTSLITEGNSNTADSFYGWEADRVVAVTMGHSIMESITRARTHLAVILFENPVDADSAIVKEESLYIKTKKIFLEAVHQGLVDHIE